MTTTNSGHNVPFPYRQQLTAMLIEYKDPDSFHIANQILPYVPVESAEYKYSLFPMSTNYSIPKDTVVGRLGETPEISWEATEDTASLETHALQTYMPRIDEITPSPLNDTMVYVERVNHCHDLRHEVEVSKLVRDASIYPTNNKMLISSATDKFSHPDSDPFAVIEGILNGNNVLLEFNKMFCGPDVWFQIQKHPAVVKTILGNANTKGRVTKEEFAAALGLDAVVIGKTRVNIAEPSPDSNALTLERCWQNDILLLHTKTIATSTRSFGFGLTAEFKTGRKSMHFFEPNRGPEGTDVYRIVHTRKPHIMAPHLGFLIKDAV